MDDDLSFVESISMSFQPERQPRSVSVVMTAYNEGEEVRRTIDSIRRSNGIPVTIHLVDDGSTDGCCDGLADEGVDLIRHSQRMGVAYSRAAGVSRSSGPVIAFLDAHQRLESGCLADCARVAARCQAIVAPDIRDFGDNRLLHGAYFVFDDQKKVFAARWKRIAPKTVVMKNSSLRAPLYIIPRTVYSRVKWSRSLRGWGGTEAAISLKAFFAGVELLHFCGPVAHHRFKEKFHYEVNWPEVWRNHALIARICFEERTWHDYWFPEVFASRLTDAAKNDLESAQVLQEHQEFQKVKVRHDREFWTRLIFSTVPAALQ